MVKQVLLLQDIYERSTLRPSGCIEWAGRRNGKDYGTARSDGRRWLAHRLAWLRAHGSLPKRLFVCHHCDNPPCVNVAHLFLGTNAENIRDAAKKGRLARGERSPAAKLDEQGVRDIVRHRAAGRSLASIARDFGVSDGTVRAIIAGKAWAHLQIADRALASRTTTRRPSGAASANAKLSVPEARRIRARYAAGVACGEPLYLVDLATEYGVSVASIENLLGGKTYPDPTFRPLPVATRGARGERSGAARLTADDVRAIRERRAAGGVGQRAIAREYRVHHSTIAAVLRGDTWTGPPALVAPATP